MERAFEIILKSPDEKCAFPVSLFVERLPEIQSWVNKFRDPITKRIDAAKSTDLHRSLSEMLQKGTSPEQEMREQLEEQHKKLREREKEIVKAEREAAAAKAQAQVASQLAVAIGLQAQIAVIQTSYQTRIAEIQSSNMSAEEKAKAMQEAAVRMQQLMLAAQGRS
jgi:hypothetical protein